MHKPNITKTKFHKNPTYIENSPKTSTSVGKNARRTTMGS
jgi:hypothetical protein